MNIILGKTLRASERLLILAQKREDLINLIANETDNKQFKELKEQRFAIEDKMERLVSDIKTYLKDGIK